MPKFVHTEDINAPVDTVWKIVADPSQWPFWFPDVTGASISGALQAGTTFQWQSHDKTGTGRVARVTPDQVLELEMDLGGNRATHTFEVSRHGGLFGGNGSRLQYTLQFQAPGGLIGEFVEGGNPADVAKAKNTAEKKGTGRTGLGPSVRSGPASHLLQVSAKGGEKPWESLRPLSSDWWQAGLPAF